ncbi:hypothetical protein [Candidatus Cyanaurora vandensis]|uniref:hypothetical protein n=1 Tax=Candidatus Cyanaurora vandensis TaxID=2714958 RepID=UPI00257E5D44|nr:hypothetical protein [Candidatus Cyanaurora vandensis]
MKLSEQAQKISTDLNLVNIESGRIFENVQERLDIILKWTLGNAIVIPFDPLTATKSLNQRYMKEPTDNLILHTILAHARTNLSERKVLLTNNYTDFFKEQIVTEQLDLVGIRKYVTKIDQFLNWSKL